MIFWFFLYCWTVAAISLAFFYWGIEMAEVTMEERKWEVERRINVLRFLEKEGINPEEVLVFINGRVVTEDAVMESQDLVEILPVLSRG